MSRKRLLSVLAMVFATAMGGQTTAARATAASSSTTAASSSTEAAPGPSLKVHNPRYQLHKSDTFEVDFAFAPEFNQTVTVGPDGYVTFKEIGSVHVEGSTIPEVTELLKNQYAKILHDPVVAISLKDFEKPFFVASGQVNHPGKYELRGPLTVTQAVAIAGGFNNDAKNSQVVIFHPSENGMFEAKLLNVKHILNARNLNEDIKLQPGDLVYVPSSFIAKIRRFWPNTAVGAYYNPATY